MDTKAGTDMKADKIKDIVDKLNKLPYKCILFDGKWGIGKTYAVGHVLKRKRNVCRISLFGLQDSQQIYHEVLCQFVLRSSMAGTICKKLGAIADRIPVLPEAGEKIKDALGSIVNEKELLLALTGRFTSSHVIVMDDLERTGKNVSFEEVMGIIEELKQCSYLKIILIANTGKMEKTKKKLLKKYNEKVIDRVYHITEKPEKINWGEMGIDAGFISGFLKKHPVKNLRTLQKAQRFYEDVLVYCESIENETFLQEIRLICFAIVIESTDRLYLKKIKKPKPQKESAVFDRLHNKLDYRIKTRYLTGIRSGQGLTELLIKYFNNQLLVDASMLNAEYQVFLKAGRKANYYKSEEEIQRFLGQWEGEISSTQNLAELNRRMDEYMYFSHILERDTEAVLEQYGSKLRDLLWQAVTGGDEDILERSVDVYFLSSGKIQKIYEENQRQLKERLVDSYIAYLTKKTSDRKAFEYSYKLKKDFDNSSYKKMIRQKAEQLYTPGSFPIEDMNENKNYTCYNIMYILYHADQEKFLRYCRELDCDKMAAYRIRHIVEAFDKGNN